MIPSISAGAPAPRIATASAPQASAAVSSLQESDDDRLVPVRRALEDIENCPFEDAQFQDDDGDPSWGPVVLFESISSGDFNKWLEKNEAHVRRWQYQSLDDDKGRVVIYSLPSSVHEKTNHGVYLSIMEQVYRAGNNDIRLFRTVFNTKSTTFQVGASRRPHYQEADESLTPVDLRVGGQVLAGTAKHDPFPNVVIEVAYMNQTFANLLEKLHNWMHPRYTSRSVLSLELLRRNTMICEDDRPAKPNNLDPYLELLWTLKTKY
ncbi:hypothetical protein AC1031_011418 [Aphanomyces cochlioides]|nr:hypothetical protein AC1031_011418 [Aphanomyces cochlioides]